MDRLDTTSYIYPYDYAQKSHSDALRLESVARTRADLAQGLGWTALAAMTGGLATGRFEIEASTHAATEKQIRALGHTPLNYLAHIPQAATAVNEDAMLGYAATKTA